METDWESRRSSLQSCGLCYRERFREGIVSASFAEDGDGRHSGYDCAWGNIASHHRIGSDGCAVSDGNAAEHGDTATDPDFAADGDGLGDMTGIAKRMAIFAGVVCVPNAGVLADHASFSDEDSGIGYEMNSGREDDAVAENNFAVASCLHILMRIDEQSFSAADAAGAEDIDGT
jgi:hypothetical protein